MAELKLRTLLGRALTNQEVDDNFTNLNADIINLNDALTQLETNVGDQLAAFQDGATGATGFTGATGAQGASGATGTVGPQGLTGASGISGATGTAGATGPAGTNGATGPVGASGSPGAAAAAGATGSVGASGVAGATGPAGTNGATGPRGLVGPQGLTGATGPLPSGIIVSAYLVFEGRTTNGVCNIIKRSANVLSVSRNGVGRYFVEFQPGTFTDADYCVNATASSYNVGASGNALNYDHVVDIATTTTTSLELNTGDMRADGNNKGHDVDRVHVMIVA